MTEQTIEQKLADVLAAHKEWYTSLDFGGAEMPDLDGTLNLRFAYLHGVNLIGADLTNAGMLGANLTGALMLSANLAGADLRGADLRGADLRDVKLRGAKLPRIGALGLPR